MRRDILLLFAATFFAVVAGYTYLHNDNLQLSAGVIFVGTFLLAWAAPKKFLLFALVTGNSILLANIYATTNQLAVPAPPSGLAEAFLAFIPAVVAGIGGMIIGGGVSDLPNKLGRPTDAAGNAALEASADMKGSGAEPYDAAGAPPASKAGETAAPGSYSGPPTTSPEQHRPFA